MIIEVSVKNNVYQHIMVLKTNRKKRNQYKEFVVEGVRNINEAIRNGWEIKYFVCDELCTIPMVQGAVASSFNVSCAASIMMYEVRRQRIKL